MGLIAEINDLIKTLTDEKRKKATVLFIILVSAIGGWFIFNQQKSITKLNKKITSLDSLIKVENTIPIAKSEFDELKNKLDSHGHSRFNTIKVQSGTESMDAANSNWNLINKSTAKPNGASIRMPVIFKEGFKKRPEVITSFYNLSYSKDFNTNISVEATNVTEKGFTISVKAWGGTNVFGVGINWIAYTK